VVDDTPESLLALTDTLSAEGYDVRPADSGELALASVAALAPELIVLDIRMPGLDGFEVCRRLKAREQSRDIPVIFLSAVTEIEERVEGLRIGAVDFVAKPFRKEELLARIETHLELSRLRQRLEQRVAERTARLKAANEQLEIELAERIRAEQALRESEARFRSMADTAPVAIWTSGPDVRINFWNRYALALTGTTQEELAGDRWREVVHPEDLELRYPNLIPLIEARRDYRVEYRIRRADGEYRWMLETATPRFLVDGAFAGYIGVMIDITDLKRNQEQLSATQKLESLGLVVSGVSHNFNNLLATILAEADLAMMDLPGGAAAYENVARISGVAIRASEIVALLMAYAGAGGKGALAPVNLSTAVEETIRLFKATVSRKAEVSVSLASDLATMRADISQIRQLVMNLLTNAWEALEKQEGSIHVTTSSVAISPDRSSGANHMELPPGKYARLEVADSGCGISADARTRIFDPFYTTKFLGRGLGLAAVQGIVRTLGGAIQVRSRPGQGSTFEVLLPCYDDSTFV